MKTPQNRQRAWLLVPVFAMAILSVACSSAPKKEAARSFGIKNDAADYTKLGDGYFFQGQYGTAMQFYLNALEANLSVDNISGSIASRNSLGRSYLALGQLDSAERELGDAIQDARASGMNELIALSLANMGELYYTRGELDRADQYFTEAASLVNDRDITKSVVLHNQGVLALAKGELEQAERYLLAAASLNDKAKRWIEYASNCYMMATLYKAHDRLPEAIIWANRALEADKIAENSLGIGSDLQALGKLSMAIGQKEAAFDYYRRAFGLWLSVGREAEAVSTLEILAQIAEDIDLPEYVTRYGQLLKSVEALGN